MADSMATNASKRVANAEKLVVRNGTVYGLTGAAALFEPMIAWHIAGADPATIPKGRDADDDATLFVFSTERAAFYKTELPFAEDFRSSPMAWGIGSEFALGALDAGADLKTAVEIAITRSVWLGGPVQVIDLESLKACEHEWVAGVHPYHTEIIVKCLKCGADKERAA